ncbi:hypothetical protein [Streptodolium elevatio]
MKAASLDEVPRLRDHANLATMGRYERQSGVLSEGNLDGWQDQPRAAGIRAEAFERLCGRSPAGPGRVSLTQQAEGTVTRT